MRSRRLVMRAAALGAALLAAGCSGSSRRSPPPPPAAPPVPLSIVSLDPTFGPVSGGTLVTLRGTGFLTGTVATVAGNLASTAVLSPTVIRFATPAGSAGPADVTVTNVNGEAVTASGAFTYGTPAPTVTGVSPSAGATSGGTLITVTGTGFQTSGGSQPAVMIGTAACTNETVRTATTLTCITGSSGSTGLFTVQVTNPDTQFGTLPNGFTYVVDSTPPTFAGLVSATAASPTQVELAWAAATDDFTTPSLITYRTFIAATSGGQNFTVADFVSTPGAVRLTVGGLSPGVSYWFVVRAVDQAGNVDTNTVERSAQTLAAPSYAYGAPAALGTARADHSLSVLTDGRVLAAGGRSGAGTLGSAQLYDPATGTWTTTSSLAAAREQHAGLLLPDGRVLVVGGFDGATSTSLVSTEIWDPATGTWSATGNTLSASRYRASATLLTDGRVFVAGGLSASGPTPVGTSEVYSTSTNTWSSSGGAMIAARDWHGAALLANGDVLVAGGGGTAGITGSAEIWSPATGTWTATGTLATARVAFGMTRLRDGRVLAIGGLIGASFTPNCELWSPATGTWTATGGLTTARGLHTTVLLPSGFVHAAAGGTNSVELYDPRRATWTSGLGIQTARDSHRAALLPSGQVLIVGGQDGSGPMASVEIETTSASNWLPAGAMSATRGRHTGCLMPDGRVLVAGGYAGDNTIGLTGLRTAELYDPAANTWTAAPSMIVARWANTQTLLPDGRALVVGGTNTGTNTVGAEAYDPSLATWTGVTAPAGARMNHSGTLLADGRVLIAGGWNNSIVFASSEVYTPATNSWTLTSGGLAGPRGWHSATRLNDGRVLVAGGWSGFGSMNSAEIWNPATGFWGSAGAFTTARFGQAATLLPDGRVLIAGGINQPTSTSAANNVTDVDVYDPATNTWSAVSALPAATAGHTATLLLSGNVLVAGGFVQPQLYWPALDTWRTEPNVLASRFVHSSVLLADGRVLLVGGRDQVGATTATCERYEPGLGFADAWRPRIASAVGSSAWPVSLPYASSVTLTGTGLRGPLEGGTGGVANTAADPPVVHLSGPLGGTTGYLDSTPTRRTLTFSAAFAAAGNSVTFASPASGAVPRGYYQLRVIANGIPSDAVTVRFP